jgi:signal transduction histidine kinase
MSTRPSFTLPQAQALRERAERAGQAGGRRGRPRARFLAEQRSRLMRRAIPLFAAMAAATGAAAIVDVASSGPQGATMTQAIVAFLLAGAAVAMPLLRKRLFALRLVATCALSAAIVAWGLAARQSGGASGPYALVPALLLVAGVGVLPLVPSLAAAMGVAGYAALWVAAPDASPSVHVVFLLACLGGVLLAWMRARGALRAFLRTERLAAAVLRLRRMQEQLVIVEKLEALRVLVGGMAHEVNNALAVALASTEQAKKLVERDAGATLAALQRAEGGLQRIRRTVDRLRRFAMAEEQLLEPADVAAMLDFALESAIGRARSGVIVDRAYDPAIGPVACHVAALAEALFQVARNAVEAMPGGGTIRAAVRREHDMVVLSVSDEGKGIPESELARVFDPFYSRGQGKTGLGLSAVYGLVSALGGTVRIKSAVGKGTEVAIVMPARKISDIPPSSPLSV